MKKPVFTVALLLLTLISVGFWVAQILGKQNQRELHTLAIESLATQLNHTIKQRMDMAQRLAIDSIAVNSLKAPPRYQDLNSIFDTANLMANTDLIYVINDAGTVVASSDSPDSPLVGRNYTFRPYFQDSIQGKPSIFPAVGAFTGLRGLHLSVPIYVENKTRPTGVLVLKIGISEVENILDQREEKIAFVSPDGIILSSNQPEWLFHSTRNIPLATKQRLLKTRQFGFKKIEPLPFHSNRNSVWIDNKKYAVARAPIIIPGWELVSFSDISIIRPLPNLYKILIISSLSVTGALALLTISLLYSVQRRKKTEIMLINAEKKYRSIFENAVMGIYQSSIEGRFVEASPSMATILGYDSPTDLIHGINDIKHNLYANPEDRTIWVNLLRAKGWVNDFITRFRRKDNQLIWVSLSCRLTQGIDNNEDMIEGFCLDITEKIQAQKEVESQHAQLIQADKMITMGILTAGVAHEINNPNTYIISSAEILSDAWTSAAHILEEYYREQAEDFLIGGMPYTTFRENLPALSERIINGSRRINRIIKELLNYSRKDSIGTNELVDVNRVMTSVETLLNSTIRKSTNHFSMQLAPECPLIRANFLRLEQVVINIIQNACQALAGPSRAIAISTSYLPDTHEVVIACKDEGVGISQENLNMITEPFFTTKRELAGTGLGLAVSSSIMRDLGGTMTFESKVGQGTTVFLKFPEEQKNS